MGNWDNITEEILLDKPIYVLLSINKASENIADLEEVLQDTASHQDLHCYTPEMVYSTSQDSFRFPRQPLIMYNRPFQHYKSYILTLITYIANG